MPALYIGEHNDLVRCQEAIQHILPPIVSLLLNRKGAPHLGPHF